jgi:salicylate hydroxylase
VVLDLAGAGDPGVVVHRASLLRELLAPLPKEILHANKKLTNIKNTGDGTQLTFQDGRIDSFDAIIGADGIFGKVREHVVGDNAEYKASPADFWDCRILMPFEKAQKTIGPEFFELDRQYGWIGDQAFIMHDVLENRTMVQVVISAIEKDHPKDRKRPLSRELATTTLSKWLDGPIASSVIEASSSITAKLRAPRLILLQLMMDEPDVQAYSQWEHKKTPTFYDGRTCIVGDAAHATTPWQGAGAGQAIEDAMILGHLLSHITSKDQVNAAFEAYDIVRRPRCQQVIDSSRGTGLIFCGQNSEIGLDPAKLRSLVPPRWGFIMALDMEAHKQDALNKMKEILGRK